MGMKRIKKLSAVVGKFTDRGGNEKSQYVNCGTLFQRDDGSFVVKLDSLPLGDFNGWLNCYDFDEDRPQNDKQGMDKAKQAVTDQRAAITGDTFDDDVPF
jgi:hypothetical protein